MVKRNGLSPVRSDGYADGAGARPHDGNIPLSISPFVEDALAQSNLTHDDRSVIQRFARDGYVILDLDIPDFDAIAARVLAGLRERQKNVGSRVLDAWRYNDAVKTIACDPAVLSWLSKLYSRAAIPFQTLNFARGTEQFTHSDLIHFSAIPFGFMAGVWFALEDVDEYNGPLHYYPGSHRLPFYDLQAMGLPRCQFSTKDRIYRQYEQFIAREVSALGLAKQTVRMKKGQCLVWAANLLHGGAPILDASRSRHSQVTHYYFEECRYFSPLYSDVFQGQVAWLAIRDVRTGKLVPQFQGGVKQRLPVASRAKGALIHGLSSRAVGRRLMDSAERLLRRA